MEKMGKCLSVYWSLTTVYYLFERRNYKCIVRRIDMNEELDYIAFVTLAEVEEGVLRGGILVTDVNGKPVEFRCTSPIQPNPVQRTLYGSTLMPHIAVELVGIPLLKSVQALPGVVLVQQEEFLALRMKCENPLLLARRQGQDIQLSEEDKKDQPEELLSSPSGNFTPVIITCHWDYPDDVKQCKEKLGWTFANCDLVEPFERVKTALRTLHEQGVLTEK